MKSKLLGAAIVAALGGLLFGFDTAVISGTTDWLTKIFGLTDFPLGFTVASALIGTIIGSIAVGKPADRLGRRGVLFVLAVFYVVTALGTASIGFATAAWHVLIARACAWLGRGVRTPVRKALLASAGTPATYGRAFGFERMMDTLGAIVGPASAFVLLGAVNHHYPTLFALTLIPGLAAAAVIAFLVKEKEDLVLGWIGARAAGRLGIQVGVRHMGETKTHMSLPRRAGGAASQTASADNRPLPAPYSHDA